MRQDFMRHAFDMLIEAAHDALSFIGIVAANDNGEHGEAVVIRAAHIHGRLARAIATAERLLPVEAALDEREQKKVER